MGPGCIPGLPSSSSQGHASGPQDEHHDQLHAHRNSNGAASDISSGSGGGSRAGTGSGSSGGKGLKNKKSGGLLRMFNEDRSGDHAPPMPGMANNRPGSVEEGRKPATRCSTAGRQPSSTVTMSQRPVRAAKVQAVEKVRGMCKKVKRPRRATAPKPVPPPSAPGVTAAMNVASADGYTEAHFEIHDLLAARKGAGGQPEVLAKFLEWVPIQHLGDADEAQQQVAQLVQRQDGWTPPIIADNAVGILSDAPAPAATHTLTAMLTPPSSPRAVPVGVF
ncbi:hypothetical protein OC835_007785, partial [Tilletia horrida]